MGVHAKKEGDEEVVGVPESLERLLSNLVMSSCVHEQHAQEHDMTGDSSRLSVVNLNGRNRANLGALDVEEVDIVSQNVDASKNQHCVGALAVEPDRLIERQKPELWSNKSHQISAHGQ